MRLKALDYRMTCEEVCSERCLNTTSELGTESTRLIDFIKPGHYKNRLNKTMGKIFLFESGSYYELHSASMYEPVFIKFLYV